MSENVLSIFQLYCLLNMPVFPGCERRVVLKQAILVLAGFLRNQAVFYCGVWLEQALFLQKEIKRQKETETYKRISFFGVSV